MGFNTVKSIIIVKVNHDLINLNDNNELAKIKQLRYPKYDDFISENKKKRKVEDITDNVDEDDNNKESAYIPGVECTLIKITKKTHQ